MADIEDLPATVVTHFGPGRIRQELGVKKKDGLPPWGLQMGDKGLSQPGQCPGLNAGREWMVYHQLARFPKLSPHFWWFLSPSLFRCPSQHWSGRSMLPP